MGDRRPERAAGSHLGRRPALACALAWLAALGALAALGGCGDDEAAPDAAELERLRSLGYVEELEPDAARRAGGVVRHDRSRTAPGTNLVHSRSESVARLVDLEGRVLREWSTGAESDNWNHVEWLPGGDVVGIVRAERIVRIGPDSAVRWSVPLAAHHDLDVLADGTVFALASRVLEIPHGGGTVPILDERVVRLAPDGRVEDDVSLHHLLAGRIPPARLDAIAEEGRGWGGGWRRRRGPSRAGRESSDVYHANSLEILRRDAPGLGRAGDALVSLRELDCVAVVDLGARRLRRCIGAGVVEAQHDARPLANGNVLLFDNGRERGWSRVVEIDPGSGAVVWEWSGDPPRSLRSARKGSAQRLENGNVLVVESDRGRAYEVTPAGEVVWELHHPRPIYRMTRLPAGSQEVNNVP